MQSSNKTCLHGDLIFVLQEKRCVLEDQIQKKWTESGGVKITS